MLPFAHLLQTMILSLACASAAACSQTASGPVVCPPIKIYSEAFSRALADEVEAMNRARQYPLTRQALREYASLRDEVRACASH